MRRGYERRRRRSRECGRGRGRLEIGYERPGVPADGSGLGLPANGSGYDGPRRSECPGRSPGGPAGARKNCVTCP